MVYWVVGAKRENGARQRAHNDGLPQRFGPYESYDRALEASRQLAAELGRATTDKLKVVCDYA